MTTRRMLLAMPLALGLLGTVPAGAQTFLTMESFPPGTTAGQLDIAFATVVQKHTKLQIQSSVGKPATKSAVDAANKKVDLFTTAPTINQFMQTKTAMFAKVENAPELNANLRAIFNFPIGSYHMVVYEDSGIKSLMDIKGKKVFLGPPAGAATKVMTQVVEGVTGYKPGEDFQAMRFDWATAETAFIDRQMDVYMVPTNAPSPQIQQMALNNKIRLLTIPEEAFASEPIKAALKFPGRTIDIIEANTYKNQMNEGPVKTVGSWVGIGTHKWLDEQVAYDLTKAFWENIGEIHATAEWMKIINRDTALREMNIPLHVGAYRYYKEAGFKIPDHAIPPEAK